MDPNNQPSPIVEPTPVNPAPEGVPPVPEAPVAPPAPEVAPPVPTAPPVPPAVPAPPPPVPPVPPGPPVQADPSQPVPPPPPAPPPAAADRDVIEKEWVDKAEQVVEKTTGDPHAEEEAVEDLQIDYLKKRYGVDVKKSPN